MREIGKLLEQTLPDPLRKYTLRKLLLSNFLHDNGAKSPRVHRELTWLWQQLFGSKVDAENTEFLQAQRPTKGQELESLPSDGLCDELFVSYLNYYSSFNS